METPQTSRRNFLKSGCVVAAAVGAAACGGTSLVMTYRPAIETPTIVSGDNKMQNRVLITYATKAGSTAEIAMKMGETLKQRNLAVDILPLAKVTTLASYKSVIIGSAIRTGSVLPEVQKFIETNKAELEQKAYKLFIVCMTLEKDTEENRKTVSAFLDPVRAAAKPSEEGLFAGVMNLSKLPLFERLMIKAMKTPVGDFRKWDQINAWTNGLQLAS